MLREARPGSGPLCGAIERFGRRPANIVALAAVGLAVLLALVPEGLVGRQATAVAVLDRFTPPLWSGGSLSHAFGTDNLGRDTLARTIFAARYSISITIAATALAALIGAGVGIVAGYAGGRADAVLSRLVDIQMAFPVVFLAVAVLAVAGSSVANLILVLALVDWAAFARVVRAVTLEVRDREFVEAARAVGAGDRRIVLSHVVPNVASAFVVLVTYAAGRVLLTESSLSFLGLGITPPATTWGGMVGDGRNYLYDASWVAIVPGAVIAALVLAISFVGDGLRDALDPRLR